MTFTKYELLYCNVNSCSFCKTDSTECDRDVAKKKKHVYIHLAMMLSTNPIEKRKKMKLCK